MMAPQKKLTPADYAQLDAERLARKQRIVEQCSPRFSTSYTNQTCKICEAVIPKNTKLWRRTTLCADSNHNAYFGSEYTCQKCHGGQK
jgi:hypothetical protein